MPENSASQPANVWPDDEPRKCSDCERVRDDVRLRINRGARLLCGPCFERPKGAA